MQNMITAGIAALSAARGTLSVYTESAIFERISHFKDVGVPGTINDKINQAMIADASCRLFHETDGYTFYHNRTATKDVIRAIEDLPSSESPSHLVLTAHKDLAAACGVPSPISESDYYHPGGGGSFAVRELASNMANWHRALCAPEHNSAWNGAVYDPAYLPQQIALTTGFMCIVSCDLAHKSLYGDGLAALASSEAETRVVRMLLCELLPFDSMDFSKAYSANDVVALSQSIHEPLCAC